MRNDPIMFANVAGRDDGRRIATPVTLSDYINAQFDPSLSWTDVDWLRTVWDGPIILKGIQTRGGRHLGGDGRRSRRSRCPTTAGASSTRAPAPSTSWHRWPTPSADASRSSATAASAGAATWSRPSPWAPTACTIGRAYLYGLGAGGERGVDHVLGLLDADIRRTMALCGARSVEELTPELLAGHE